MIRKTLAIGIAAFSMAGIGFGFSTLPAAAAPGDNGHHHRHHRQQICQTTWHHHHKHVYCYWS